MLARLVGAFAPSEVQSTVLSLANGGALSEAISASGVPVIGLGMRAGRLNVAGVYRACRLIHSLRPDILQTWLYHADLVGLLAGTLAGVPAIVWNIRCAALEPRDHPATLSQLLRLLAWASRWPSAVVSNSAAGMKVHERLGYRPSRWVIIANGFDMERHQPCPVARRDFRREIGVDDRTPLIGLVARAHPMKDHPTFLEAAAIVASRHPEATFVAVGRGVPESVALRDLIAKLGLDKRTRLLPERYDVPRILAALDVLVSSSYSEAFPNIVAEAMACGTLPVVTDVGDSALIVGSAGRVVQPRDPAALAEAIVGILEMDSADRKSLEVAARARILDAYSIGAIARQYEQLYGELVRQKERSVACAG